MSLAAQLTYSYLRELGVAYPRDEAYFEERRVLTLVITGGAVEGTVRGSAVFQARIELLGGTLRSACTCPIAAGCKHVVALGLAYLAEEGVSDGTALRLLAAKIRSAQRLRHPRSGP